MTSSPYADWDEWERIQAALAERGDGLPLVPPSAAAIERMLADQRLSAGTSIATLAPAFGEATWHSIAENALMAGCRADYLPVVGAAVKAVAQDAFNLLGIQTTTGAAAPLIIVNGPVAGRIGMNAGGNALGPGNRANATIGRALHLVLQNVGGARPGEMDMATLGHPGKYTFCLAENEADSPWAALHTERGFSAGKSAVTLLGATGFIEVVDSVSTHPEELVRTYAGSMVFAGSAGMQGLIGSGQPLLVLPPEHALLFDRGGFSKEDLKNALYREAVLELERLSPAVQARIRAHRASAGEEPGLPLRIAQSPSDVLIVVAGGAGVKAAYVPTWGGSRAVTTAVMEP